MCHKPKSKSQKQITLTPNQFQLAGRSIKGQLQKLFRGTQTSWNNILKPANNATAPFVGMAVSAKTKNPKAGQATPDTLKSISDGKKSSLITAVD